VTRRGGDNCSFHIVLTVDGWGISGGGVRGVAIFGGASRDKRRGDKSGREGGGGGGGSKQKQTGQGGERN
jgi:hypothetical protein